MSSDATSPSLQAVFVWDSKSARITQLWRALREQGITLRALESRGEPSFADGGTATLTLIALGEVPTDQEVALSLIRHVRRSNSIVLAFEDGVSRWPLRARCRVLLAGAKQIFDSAGPEFLDEVARHVRAKLQELSSRIKEEQSTRETLKELGVVGESPALMAVERLVVRVSGLSNLPVLLSGETGTGKELLAQAIHALDPKRCRGPFVALNCAALSHDLAEAELFGHRRGAFTGAEYERKGLFRAAAGGVIFLDEIAELQLELQAKLLRVLQENRLLVLGEDRETEINVRLLAATNQDLRGRVAQGAFRADLFHRLNVLPIHVPPLRERPEDVEVLVRHFLEKHRALNPVCSRMAAPEFIEGLQSTGLPGNVRQVENIVRQAIARKENNAPLSLADLPPDLWQELAASVAPPDTTEKITAKSESSTAPLSGGYPSFPQRLLEEHAWNLPRSVRHFERLLLEVALRRTNGNQSETARLLGITPRSIYNKLRQNLG